MLRIIGILVAYLILSACSTPLTDEGDGVKSYEQSVDRVRTVGVALPDQFEQSSLNVGNQIYYFDFDQSTVYDNDLASIKVQARYLAEHPEVTVLLTGNTDERGSREYNIGLGQRRAQSVANLLLTYGVEKRQIALVSYGAEKPRAFGHSEEDYSKNRRVELQYRK
jgi:peptidoglycan-associated lipoprotein